MVKREPIENHDHADAVENDRQIERRDGDSLREKHRRSYRITLYNAYIVFCL